MTEWSDMVIMPQLGGPGRVWEGDVLPPCRKSNNIKPILGMPYAHKVCTVFIKQNLHENELIFVFH